MNTTTPKPTSNMIPAYYHGRPNSMYLDRFLTGTRVRRTAAAA